MLGLRVVSLRLVLGALVLLAPAAVAGLESGARSQTDRQTRIFALPPGRSISVNITIGTVRVEGTPRTDASVEIVRTASAAGALARIPVDIEESDSEVRISAVQAGDATDPALRTDLTLQVPAAAVVKSIRIMEGRLTISRLRGEINADVRRGPIEATDVQGVVRLETGIGPVTASRMTLVPDGLLRLRAFNGDLRLSLTRRPTDARVLALALNGTISSDIPLQMKDTWGPRWGEATLGKGEPVISLDVVTGKITIEVGG